MLVGEDVGELTKRILERFPGTRDEVIDVISADLAPYPIDLVDDAIANLRGIEPSNYLRAERLKLIAEVRKLSVSRGFIPQSTQTEPSRVPAKAAPPGMRKPDRRTQEQRDRDEKRKQTIEWIESLCPDDRSRLLELALMHWPDGDERAMFRTIGIKSVLVREQMVFASKRCGDDPDPSNRALPAPQAMTFGEAVALLESIGGVKLPDKITDEDMTRAESACSRKCHPDAGGTEAEWLRFRQALAVIRTKRSESA